MQNPIKTAVGGPREDGGGGGGIVFEFFQIPMIKQK